MAKRSKHKRKRSKQKRRRTAPSLPTIPSARRFSRESLLALLDAASCSPTASHRLQSLGVLFASVLHAADSEPDTTAADLPALLNEVSALMPLQHLEDYLPSDPRRVVLVRWRHQLFRIMPGSLERPVAMIERARIVAEAIDTTLVDALGFSLSDMCELVLRRVDTAASVFAECWGNDRTDTPGAAASVTDAEVAAARRMPSVAETVVACTNPARAANAVAWSTNETLEYDPSAARATFGRTLVVQPARDVSIPIPSGFWIDALDTIINDLAAAAAGVNPQVDLAFRERAEIELARIVRRLKLPVRHRVPVRDLGHIHSVIGFGRRTQIAIDLSTGLRNRVNEADKGFVQSLFEVFFFRFRSSRARSSRVGVSMPEVFASRVRNSW